MANCKKCGKEIYFLKTKNDKLIPVNRDSISVVDRIAMDNGRDVMFQYGTHISHFATCEFAVEFRINQSKKESK